MRPAKEGASPKFQYNILRLSWAPRKLSRRSGFRKANLFRGQCVVDNEKNRRDLRPDFADALGDGGAQGFADSWDGDSVKDFLEKARHDHLNGLFPR